MAKRKKTITEEEPVANSITIPPAAEVEKAVKRLATMQKTVQSASGDMGEFVNKICEDKDFDKRALGIARRLHAMPDEKFSITWQHLKAYAEALGFDERAEQQPDMFEAEEETNVRSFRAPRSVPAEAEAG